MKFTTLIITLVLCFAGFAQQPETVYGFAKERKEESWYQTQLQLWKKETEKAPANANAWYNYYRAGRALRILSQDDAKWKEYDDLCHKIVEDCYAKNPETFEANHMKWMEGGRKTEVFVFLKKAYEINPNDSRAYEDLATYYETSGNKAEYSKSCKLMYTSNVMPAPLLNWGYNMLAEVDQNSVLFTAGDNDTYAAWVIQEAKNFRKDVRIVNLSLMLINDYRNKLLKDLGLPPLDVDMESSKTQEEFNEARKKIMDHFIANNKKRPVYIAVSAIHNIEEFTDIKEQLYLTGLCYKYASESFDNVSIVVRNFEHRYLLDHLKMTFSHSIGEQIIQHINGCYVPAMMVLYQHYKDSEQTAKLKELESLLLSVSELSGQLDAVKSTLEIPNKSTN